MVRLYNDTLRSQDLVFKPLGILRDDSHGPGQPQLQALVLCILQSVGRPLTRKELLPLLYAVGRPVQRDRLSSCLRRMRVNGTVMAEKPFGKPVVFSPRVVTR